MKTILYDTKGNKKGEIELPAPFSTKIREDIVQKYLSTERFLEIQPFAPNPEAGKRHSASGTISHKRHDFKGHYGRGISRIPRKTMSRRGTNFFWIGAEVTSTRGGRKAHPPKLRKRLRRVNKKEIIYAMNSAIAATAQEKYILERYSTLDKVKIQLPLVIESKLDKIKTKDLVNSIKNILQDTFSLALKKKSVRAGKGKSRGRKYKSNAGLLLIKSNEEDIKMKGIEIKSTDQIYISDLYPLGRITLYTEKALKDLGAKR